MRIESELIRIEDGFKHFFSRLLSYWVIGYSIIGLVGFWNLFFLEFGICSVISSFQHLETMFINTPFLFQDCLQKVGAFLQHGNVQTLFFDSRMELDLLLAYQPSPKIIEFEV
jgi:hypothetical protein